MAEEVAGFPFWEVRFDETGAPVEPAALGAFVDEVGAEGITDLLIFSHGWNNTRSYARELYGRYFGEMRGLLDRGDATPSDGVNIGTAGVIWPSMRWADEVAPGPGLGGAASAARRRSDAELVEELKGVFTAPDQLAAIDELARLLEDKPDDPRELKRFQQLTGTLVSGPDAADAPEDHGEIALVKQEPRVVFARFAGVPPRRRRGGAAGLGDSLERLWQGAKEALRNATYFEMKKRAGVVGKTGLGPLVGRLHATLPELRVHLIGHSFGARLVSFALAGLSSDGTTSPIKSVILLQGAFSHFAFADALPHDPDRGGALAGMLTRVDGPMLVTHSLLDTAVSRLYPMASLVSRDDAAAMDDAHYRWGAIGCDGAQAVDAAELRMEPATHRYDFGAAKVFNLDSNHIIKTGDPPSGAHSDIWHPEIAWANLVAAGIVKTA